MDIAMARAMEHEKRFKRAEMMARWVVRRLARKDGEQWLSDILDGRYVESPVNALAHANLVCPAHWGKLEPLQVTAWFRLSERTSHDEYSITVRENFVEVTYYPLKSGGYGMAMARQAIDGQFNTEHAVVAVHNRAKEAKKAEREAKKARRCGA